MPQRNIVLLSDGTGNSSISPTKSNVWRLFESLDLGPNAAGEYTQFAFYDDGVGTSGFKLLRVLGGGFGWGLSRNVRDLYRALCREYRPGDKIYIFGFSRGAFTVRVLAHFIIRCGILDRSKPAPGQAGTSMESERGLRRGVRQAYKSYRRGYWDNASTFLRGISRPLRLLRNLFPSLRVDAPEDFKAQYSLPRQDGEPTIEFIGVFDTVDALGLPIAELRTLIDRWVYPYKFPNQVLSDAVGGACHALAVDDERHTFHPLLWDETDAATIARPDRLKQVWFSGMHSNVGGSYPEDNLAHIALDWIIDEVRASRPEDGLVFNERSSADFQQRATPLGKLYDSRRGAAMYYRYAPRNIEDLCNQPKAKRLGLNKVRVPAPKIHHSVLDRIADLKVGYAPTALPLKFRVVLENGIEIDPDITWTSYSEPLSSQMLRWDMMERAKGHILWRRVTYVVLLVATLMLALTPYLRPPIPGLIPNKDNFEGSVISAIGAAFRYASGYLPEFASYWTDAWTQSAWWFIGLVGGFVVLFLWTRWVSGKIGMVSEAGWWHLKSFPDATRFNVQPRTFERKANRLRRSRFGKWLAGAWLAYLLPYGFAAICLLILAGALYRALWHYPLTMDGVCSLPRATLAAGQADTDDKLALPVAVQPRTVTFSTATPCFNTGVELEAGRHYEVTVSVISEWRDEGIAATPGGFVSFFDKLRLSPFIPLSRHPSLPWFALTGEIGIDSGYIFPLNRETFRFVPGTTGTLYLYVNDAIAAPACPIWVLDWLCPFNLETWDWDRYYRNNSGRATATIAYVKR